MEDDLKYEMRIPAGVNNRTMVEVIKKFDLEIKHTDEGPLLYGEKEKLEDARDYIVKALNDRIKELEGP
ncbi:MAG: hypothetical protein A4E27_00512 [Methanobacterium sp. PtaU1.Bin242]|nr:MAG: hypothetical protein A4E27_00512 [Methanobacterium sp. PtaU1.Bin242]